MTEKIIYTATGRKIVSVEDSIYIDKLEFCLTMSNGETCGSNMLGTPHNIPIFTFPRFEDTEFDLIIKTIDAQGTSR